MSAAYNSYLMRHLADVQKGFEWMEKHLPQYFDYDEKEALDAGWRIENHDKSKFDPEEYQAYDNYFYGDKTAKVVEEFNRAWLHHIHNNPHHWQYWLLIEDDPFGTYKAQKDASNDEAYNLSNEGLEAILGPSTVPYVPIMMPHYHVCEMVADWWSFSWKTGNLFEIFDWYDAHKNGIKLHPKTAILVNGILAELKQELTKEASQYIQEKGEKKAAGLKITE